MFRICFAILNLNKLIENTPYESVSLQDIITESANKPDDKKEQSPIYNQ